MTTRGRGLAFRSILVPHDFSRHADRALGLAATLAGPRGRLTVLHVVADFPEGLNRIARAVSRRAGPATTGSR